MRMYRKYYTRDELRAIILNYISKNDNITIEDIEQLLRPLMFDYQFGLKRFTERLMDYLLKSRQIIIKHDKVSKNARYRAKKAKKTLNRVEYI